MGGLERRIPLSLEFSRGPEIEVPYNFYLELRFLHHFTPSPDILATAIYHNTLNDTRIWKWFCAN